MTFDSFTAVFFTLAFFVPGFVFYATMALAVRPRAEDVQLTLVRLLTLSAVNYALWSWLIYLLLTLPFFASHPVSAAVLWAWIVLLSPVLLGLLLALADQRQVMQRVLRALGLRAIRIAPTAWDYIFGSLRGDTWLLVTLRDGRSVAGLFGSGSFASNTATERDLFLEVVYGAGDDGRWSRAPHSSGILLKGEEIVGVEFFRAMGR